MYACLLYRICEHATRIICAIAFAVFCHQFSSGEWLPRGALTVVHTGRQFHSGCFPQDGIGSWLHLGSRTRRMFQLSRTFGQNRGDAANATQIRGPGYLTTCTAVGTNSTSNLGSCVSSCSPAASVQSDTHPAKSLRHRNRIFLRSDSKPRRSVCMYVEGVFLTKTFASTCHVGQVRSRKNKL